MSNFWANKLGVAQPAVPVPTPVQNPVSPWFAPPQYQQPQTYNPQAQYTPLPEPEHHGWGTIEGSKRNAESAKLSERCPDCGSGDYFAAKGVSNAMKQCHACGYNPRFSQTGGQAGLPSGQGGPATPARQVGSGGAGGVSQYRPDVIVNR